MAVHCYDDSTVNIVVAIIIIINLLTYQHALRRVTDVYSECSGVLDVAFVLHSAGTVHAERWKFMTQFVEDVVAQLDVDERRTRVSLVYWSDSAHVAFTLDAYNTRQDVIAVVQSMLYTQRLYSQWATSLFDLT